MRARRIPLAHGAHVTGWHPVQPTHGMVRFESALEPDRIASSAIMTVSAVPPDPGA